LGDWTPWREVVSAIACPILLITADNERGALVTPQVAAEAQSLSPALELVHIAGAGHSIRREAFHAYLEAVEGFLAWLRDDDT
jgi:pimeloyl-ACP methyl ester carboxylesterase